MMKIRMQKSMRIATLFVGITLLLGGCATNTQNQVGGGAAFTPAQEAAISNIVAKTLINNPSILVETVEALKVQQEAIMNQNVNAAIVKNRDMLTADPNSPVVGKADAPVIIIEFFDYQCAYCHQAFPAIQAVIHDHPNVKVVYKEFPIFGNASVYAAKMSLAANMQGRFEPFNTGLFESGLMEGQLTPKAVNEIAETAEVNIQVAMDEIQHNASFQEELNQNQFLASVFGMRGTPDFIVMPNSPNPSAMAITFLPGAVSEETLNSAIITAETNDKKDKKEQ